MKINYFLFSLFMLLCITGLTHAANKQKGSGGKTKGKKSTTRVKSSKLKQDTKKPQKENVRESEVEEQNDNIINKEKTKKGKKTTEKRSKLSSKDKPSNVEKLTNEKEYEDVKMITVNGTDVKFPKLVCAVGGEEEFEDLNGLYAFNSTSVAPHYQYVQVAESSKKHVLQSLGNKSWLIFETRDTRPIARTWSAIGADIPTEAGKSFISSNTFHFTLDTKLCPNEDEIQIDTSWSNFFTEEARDFIGSNFCAHTNLWMASFCVQHPDPYECLYSIYAHIRGQSRNLQDVYCENVKGWGRPPPPGYCPANFGRDTIEPYDSNMNVDLINCRDVTARFILDSMETHDNITNEVDTKVVQGDLLVLGNIDITFKRDPQNPGMWMIAKGSKGRVLGGQINGDQDLEDGYITIYGGAITLRQIYPILIGYIPKSGLLGQIVLNEYQIRTKSGKVYKSKPDEISSLYVEAIVLECPYGKTDSQDEMVQTNLINKDKSGGAYDYDGFMDPNWDGNLPTNFEPDPRSRSYNYHLENKSPTFSANKQYVRQQMSPEFESQLSTMLPMSPLLGPHIESTDPNLRSFDRPSQESYQKQSFSHHNIQQYEPGMSDNYSVASDSRRTY